MSDSERTVPSLTSAQRFLNDLWEEHLRGPQVRAEAMVEVPLGKAFAAVSLRAVRVLSCAALHDAA